MAEKFENISVWLTAANMEDYIGHFLLLSCSFFEFTISCNLLRIAGSGSPEASSNEMEKKRSRRSYRSKTYNVVISYAAKVPMQSIVDALNGKESEHFQEAVRVLDIILSQHAAKQ